MEKIKEAINGMEGLKEVLPQLLLKLNYQGMGSNDAIEAAEHLTTSISALKKQIPLKPKFHDYDRKYFECTNCDEDIYFDDEAEYHKYCLNCGQAIDWNE